MSDESTDLQAQVTALQGQVGALESQVSALQAQISAQQTSGDSDADDDIRPYGGPGP